MKMSRVQVLRSIQKGIVMGTKNKLSKQTYNVYRAIESLNEGKERSETVIASDAAISHRRHAPYVIYTFIILS